MWSMVYRLLTIVEMNLHFNVFKKPSLMQKQAIKLENAHS